MRLSKQARRDAKELFRTCQVNGLLDENRVRQAVTAVLQRKPRDYMAVLHFFTRLVKLDLDRRTARVESALPLPADLTSSVEANLGRLYGAGLTTSFLTNPALVGGMRVRVGSDVYDGSILGRLEALKESF
jgi:F-type H+-transporting ATPase subunit delta